MSEPHDGDLGKTMLRRIEQYQDRWTSSDDHTGIIQVSEKPTPHQLKELEIFSDYDETFLERISPDVSITTWRKGSVLFEEGSYIDLAFFLLSGEVEVFVETIGDSTEPIPIFDLRRTAFPQGAETGYTQLVTTPRLPTSTDTEITFLASMDFDLPRGSGARLGPGDLFGEIGALSGWPQSVTARTTEDCQLVQIRVNALRLMKRKSKALKERVDSIYRERSLGLQLSSSPLFRGCSQLFIEGLKETIELISLDPGEELVPQGAPAGDLFMVRSGFVKLLQDFGEGKIVSSYLSKGMTLGEVELLIEGIEVWQSGAVSVEYSELIRVPGDALQQLLRTYPEVEDRLWRTAVDRLKEAGYSRRDLGHAEFTQVALDSGLVQGNSILVIDLEACTRCDDCVRACAATHEGRPRFVREGNKVDNLLVPRSCYHCRDPVCLVGCPTGAIHRAGVADVVEIEERICIGCSSCSNNCPYDAIVMHETGEQWADNMIPAGLRGKDRLVASKCDLCHDSGHGPACTANCPQGCAYRVGSLDEFRDLMQSRE